MKFFIKEASGSLIICLFIYWGFRDQNNVKISSFLI